ncbi:type IV pilus biogenesis/stability protein PilW [Pseudoalteromonas sp. YIC-827]|uniref:Type IV pilus biogenesis/stability protein PilW n=1 Tax=Pseudoalteromonas qingdaonensis TaxID=3131913 RepID=A0ABU9MZR1_9GAMM
MRKLLATSISLLALGGCVTESTYVGSDKPVVEKKINNVEAARTRISLALNYLSQGDSTQAKYNLERAAKFAPELPEVHYSIAYYYQQVGEKQRAKDAYEKALSIEPNDPNTLNNYGVFLCDIGEYELAVDKFMAAIEVPSYLRVAESYENLALCALEFNKFDAAESFLEDSLQHSSLRPSSLLNLAAVKYAKSDFHNAQQVLKRYERTGRVTSRSLLLGYLIQDRMGHIEDARKLSETITVTYPSSIEARIIREQRYSASEFERLRDQYRRYKLSELQEGMEDNHIVAKPKIKVVKKKASAESEASDVVLTAAAPAAEFVETPVASVADETAAEVTAEVVDTVAEQTDVKAEAEPSTESAELEAVAQEAETALETLPETLDEVAEEAAAESSVVENQASEQMAAVATTSEQTTEAANELVSEPAASAQSAEQELVSEVKPSTELSAEPASEKSDESSLTTLAEQKDQLQSELAREFASIQLAENVTAEDQPEDKDMSEQLVANSAELEEAAESNEQVEDMSPAAEEVTSKAKVVEQMAVANTASKKEIPYHVIQRGENLFSISTRYNIRLSSLRKWNNLASADHVQVGRKIYLQQVHNYHTVVGGDTLSEISLKYNVRMEKLMEWNLLEENSKLVPGDKIYIADPKNYRL